MLLLIIALLVLSFSYLLVLVSTKMHYLPVIDFRRTSVRLQFIDVQVVRPHAPTEATTSTSAPNATTTGR